MPNALSPVTFHGDTIFCTTYQNQPYTAMKPIIENMGLAWQPQARKLTACKERWGITIMVIPTSSGDQQTLCMPVRKLPAFLNTINPKKVRPELRERIELYQNESDDVLWEYWTNQQASREIPANSLSIEDRRPLSVLIGQWAGKAKMSFPDCWRELHTVFGITTVSELPSSQLPAALAWVQAKIDGLSTSVHSDVHSDIHSNVPTMSPFVPNVPDFPMELANSGRKGDKVLNLWEELEELRMKLASCNNMVFFTCTSGRLMFLPPEKLLLHEILRDSVKQAQDSLSQAQRAVQSALRLKHRVDFHNI